MSTAEIVRKILKQSPPNELKDVLEDLKVLTDIDADDLNACLKEFNEQQLNTVDVEGVRTLITPQSQLNQDKYYDPKSSKVYKLDQFDLKAENIETVDQLSYKNDTRSLLEQPLDDYVQEYFSNGTAVVYTTLNSLKHSEERQPEPEQESQPEPELQEQEEQVEKSEQSEEAANEDEETQPGEASEPPKEEGESATEAKEEEKGDEQEDAGTSEQQGEAQPKDAEDTQAEDLEEAQPTPVQESNTQDTQEVEPEEISAINIYYAGNKYNQSNYWSGRWRAKWVYDLTNNELAGNIDITIHYFENGNVQLQASHHPKIKSPFEGPPTTPEEAKKLVKTISESDRRYQAYLNVLYEDKLSEKLFRSLRRALPITREKIDWDKVVNYKLGSELGKLNN